MTPALRRPGLWRSRGGACAGERGCGRDLGSRTAGFTLVEVMLVMAILSMVMTLMWTSFSQASRGKQRVEAAQERTHTVRVALLRMDKGVKPSRGGNNERWPRGGCRSLDRARV